MSVNNNNILFSDSTETYLKINIFLNDFLISLAIALRNTLFVDMTIQTAFKRGYRPQ